MEKKKITVAKILILLVIASIGTITYVYKNGSKFNNLILPGVMVENIDLSLKSKNEARNILQKDFGDEVLKKKIYISTDNKVYTIDYKKLDGKYNIEDAVNEAYSYGKNLNIFAKQHLIKKPKGKKISLKFSYDPRYIEEIITSIQKDVNKSPVNAKITLVQGGKFNITPETKGAKLLSDKLQKDIIAKIDGELNSNTIVSAEVEVLEAKITEEKLAKIDRMISTFSTSFVSSSSERANNIVVASKSINGSLIMPGDSFSFNGVVGMRTISRGYMSAGIIVGNKFESGIGGGVCQVSGTLYNAMLRTSIKSKERTHHTIPSSYIEKGLDATIDYGNIDYKFVNTMPYPIYIEASTEKRELTFNIYSNTSLTKRSYDIYTDVYETIQPKTNFILDGTLNVGDEIIEQIAYVGYKVKVYKRTIENGAIISTELVSNDYYKQVEGIIKIGTKIS